MPKLVIYLRDQDHNALEALSQQEYRVPKAQAALIIRQELERRGLVAKDTEKKEEGQYEYPDAS